MSAYTLGGRAERGAAWTVLDYTITFAPWVAYVIFTHVLGSWKYGFLVGLALSAAIVVLRTARRDSRFIDVGTLAYCAVMAGISLSDPGSPLRPYNLPMSLGVVGGLSSASLAMRSPFTYRIARDHVPKALLESPDHHHLLYRAHVRATSSWAGGQLAAGAASAAMVAAKAGSAAVVAVQSVGTLLPVATTRFQHARVARQFETAARGNEGVKAAGAPEEVRTESEEASSQGRVGEEAVSPEGSGETVPDPAGPTL